MQVQATSRKAQEIVHTVLAHEGGPVGRTRLVKLLFLADVEAVRRGQPPITSARWRHFHFGPHLWVPLDAAEELAQEGFASRHPWESDPGTEGTDYRSTDKPLTHTCLSEAEVTVLRDVVSTCRDWTLQDIKAHIDALPIVSSTPQDEDIDLGDLARRPWFYEGIETLHERFDDELRDLAR